MNVSMIDPPIKSAKPKTLVINFENDSDVSSINSVYNESQDQMNTYDTNTTISNDINADVNYTYILNSMGKIIKIENIKY
ncbi:MAG: hypothetical protein OEZ01_11270 [Candidatus Heimdallarchaeota archaeon]|nr:hypothetical protein [Candidatus Heimdallarchaeota archaeon]MDH5646582.1 hypothetical protein [Candidatus Heimdallarchaeota archaeon]